MTDPQLPETLAEAAPRLGLRVYGASTLGVRRSALEAAGVPQAMPAVRHVAGDVSVGAEYELDDGRVVPLSDQNLATWGVGLDEVLDAARERLSDGEITGISALGEGVYLIENELLVAAALLAPELVSGLPVTGDLTLLPAAGPVAVCTGSEHAAGLGAALNIVDQLSEAEVTIETASPLVLRDSAWEPFDVAAAHPELARAVALAKRLAAVDAYGAQAGVLADDAFIAKAKLFTKPDGDAVMVATWTDGVETLLPQTDEVLVVRGENDVTPYPFAEFLERAGSSAVRGDTVPVRYRVSADALSTAR